MQRLSGSMSTTPDEFVITSLDVVIHRDKKLGQGGFAQVFQADWQGITVAVKTLDKSTPPAVRDIPMLPKYKSFSFTLQMFQKEINVWKKLRHPNILQFFVHVLSQSRHLLSAPTNHKEMPWHICRIILLRIAASL